MRVMAISLLAFLFLLPLVSSLDFNFTSPAEVNQNEGFSVDITSDSISESYDVKIYVTDDTKEFSEIYDGTGWKSSQNYLISFYSEIKMYQVRAHIPDDNTTICVRLRKTGTKTTPPAVCKPIKVNLVESQEDSSQEEPQTDDDAEEPALEDVSDSDNTSGEDESSSDEDSSDSEDSSSSTAPSSSAPQIAANSISHLSEEDSRIVLNSKKESSIPEFNSTEEKVRLSMIYAFSVVCVIIIILLSLKRL